MKPNNADSLLLSKFKLYLDEHLQQTDLGNGLNITDVIADYLRAFHLHVCTELLKGFAGNYDQSRFRYVTTYTASFCRYQTNYKYIVSYCSCHVE